MVFTVVLVVVFTVVLVVVFTVVLVLVFTVVLVMVFTVVLVVVFGICWAPFHTDRLMWSFIDHWSSNQLNIFQYVHVISCVFFYLSFAVNRVLYHLMSSRFREMFKGMVCQRRLCQRRLRPPAPCRKQSLSMTRLTLRSTPSDGPQCNTIPLAKADNN